MVALNIKKPHNQYLALATLGLCTNLYYTFVVYVKLRWGGISSENRNNFIQSCCMYLPFIYTAAKFIHICIHCVRESIIVPLPPLCLSLTHQEIPTPPSTYKIFSIRRKSAELMWLPKQLGKIHCFYRIVTFRWKFKIRRDSTTNVTIVISWSKCWHATTPFWKMRLT